MSPFWTGSRGLDGVYKYGVKRATYVPLVVLALAGVCKTEEAFRHGIQTILGEVACTAHFFEIARLPCAIESRSLWPIDTEVGEPPLAGGSS